MFVNTNDIDGTDNIYGTIDDGLVITAISPAVDAGLNTGITPFDIAGSWRLKGNAVDIGAYESECLTNCPMAKLYGYVQEAGSYQNGQYRTYAGVIVKTNNGFSTVSDINGYYELLFEVNNLPSSVSVSDPDYNLSTTNFDYTSGYNYNRQVNLQTYLKRNRDLLVNVTSGRNRPGFTMPYYVTVENRGKTNMKANVKLELDQSLTYVTKPDQTTPTSTIGKVISWDSVLVESGKSVLLKVYATLNVNTALGKILNNKGQLFMSVQDDDVSNNILYYLPEVTGSYDPNDKLVTPQGAYTDNYVRDTTGFEYTINFQNLGTDTAFTVVVKDKIDSDLDFTTFNMVDASHNYELSIKGDTMIWTFNDILLPDDKVNEPASHGFIRFTIKQKKNNPQGTVITNKVAIYFDYNAPIITNETKNIVNNQIVTSLEEKNAKVNGTINIYPNPVNNKLYVQISEDATFVLINALGEEVLKTKDLQNINLEDFATGAYMYKILTKEAVYSGKLIKE